MKFHITKSLRLDLSRNQSKEEVSTNKNHILQKPRRHIIWI